MTTVARSGHLEDAKNGDRFIVLEDGRRYEGQPGNAEFRTAEFEKLDGDGPRKCVRSSFLQGHFLCRRTARRAAERAELFWRISVPISAFLLVFLAVPLSYVNTRVGRSFNLFTAVFVYMLYSNCLNIVQSFIAQGRLSLSAGLLLIHPVMAAMIILLCYRRLSVFGWFPRRGPA